jgi:hypothetical protein
MKNATFYENTEGVCCGKFIRRKYRKALIINFL